MFDLNSNKVEKYLAKDTIFQIEDWPWELKFNVQTILNTHFHFNGFVLKWDLFDRIIDYELFFFCNAVVVTIDYNINVIS